VQAWQDIAQAHAPDGTLLELRRRGSEYLIRAGGFDLMSSEDASSSRALARLGCAHLSQLAHRAQRMPTGDSRVLVGGLGMGFTAEAALEITGPRTRIEVAELVPEVADWNRESLAELAGRPLDNPRLELVLADVGAVIERSRSRYDAILLDVDNGPDSLAHTANQQLYNAAGIASARRALRPAGVLAVWSFSRDASYTSRLKAAGFTVSVERVTGSGKGRGRHHYVWLAQAPRKALS
jgi:spermidine synthase